MKPVLEGELRSDLISGLKQGVLIAAAALVITLPPAGLATLRSPHPSAASTTAATAVERIAPIDRGDTFRPADFGAHAATADVRFIADWVADSGDNRGLPYVILDKRDARVYVFDAAARIVDSSPVLLGAASGDDSVEGIGTRPMHLVRPEEKTTPAGRFVAWAGRNASAEDVVWVDYDAAVSMHRVRLVDVKERRLERLASPDPAQRRISYGCINVPVAFFDSVVWPLLSTSQAVVYVLPETRDVETVFASAYDAIMKVARRQSPHAPLVNISRQ